MGKNRKNKQSENNSEKWEKRFNKTVDFAGKVLGVAGSVITVVAGAKALKKK